MARTRKPTIAERQQAGAAQRREAVATLGVLTRLRQMVGEALASGATGTRGTTDSDWHTVLNQSFAELQVRMDEIKRAQPTGVVVPTEWKLEPDGEAYTEEEARDIMRKLHAVVVKELARQEEEHVPRTPEIRKIQRIYREFQESYERMELSEQITVEVNALLQDIRALRDLSSGKVMTAMLGGAPNRGAN